jgi:hypothetical protein
MSARIVWNVPEIARRAITHYKTQSTWKKVLYARYRRSDRFKPKNGVGQIDTKDPAIQTFMQKQSERNARLRAQNANRRGSLATFSFRKVQVPF